MQSSLGAFVIAPEPLKGLGHYRLASDHWEVVTCVRCILFKKAKASNNFRTFYFK